MRSKLVGIKLFIVYRLTVSLVQWSERSGQRSLIVDESMYWKIDITWADIGVLKDSEYLSNHSFQLTLPIYMIFNAWAPLTELEVLLDRQPLNVAHLCLSKVIFENKSTL